MATNLHELHSSLHSAAARLADGDEDAPHAALAQVLHAADTSADVPGAGEAVLACVLQAFTQGGEPMQALLAAVALELLPRLSTAGASSPRGALLLSELWHLAARCAPPREAFTAALEALDALTRCEDGPGALLLQLAVVDVLPQLLARLQRRRAMFLAEALAPVAAVAEVHGAALRQYVARCRRRRCRDRPRTSSASSGAADGPAHRATVAVGADGDTEEGARAADEELARSWGRYLAFAREAERSAVQAEADAGARATAQQLLGGFLLALLTHLTPGWEPPTQPPPGTGAGAGAPAAPASAQVVRQLTQLLPGLAVATWRDLAACAARDGAVNGAAAGAGLAAYYSLCLEGPLQTPSRPLLVLKVGCQLALAVAAAAVATQDADLQLKAVRLLQRCGNLAAGAADAVSAERPSSGVTTYVAPPPGSGGASAGAQREGGAAPLLGRRADAASEVAQPAPDMGAMWDLMQHLPLAVDMLCRCMAGAGGEESVPAARTALDALLAGLPPRERFSALEQLLGTCHPEAAALLLHALRREVVAAWPRPPTPLAPGSASASAAQDSAQASCFAQPACAELALAWLRPTGLRGYLAPDALPRHANAISAALNLLRFVLLRSRSSRCDAWGLTSDLASKQLVDEVLKPMAVAVDTALVQLQQAHLSQHPLTDAPASGDHATAAGATLTAEASGDGRDVDAWLALCRVQVALSGAMEDAQA